VGRSGDYGHEHAFITGSQGVGMTDLDTLTGSQSFAEAINEAGQVVGYFETADGPHAFVTGPNGEGIADLNSLVNLPEDIRLDTAVAINNHGQVVAYGVSVIPERKPYVMLLAGLGFVGLAVRRRFYRSLQSPA
jgi:probable HAF family extracellular repeat protein